MGAHVNRDNVAQKLEIKKRKKWVQHGGTHWISPVELYYPKERWDNLKNKFPF